MNKPFKIIKHAIISDIDGTLTDNSLLIPYPTDDIEKCRHDFYKQVNYYKYTPDSIIKPIPQVIHLVKSYIKQGVTPFFITAREDTCNGLIRRNTFDFLRQVFYESDGMCLIKPEQLLMREEHDLRPNYEVKEELYKKYIKDNFKVLFSLEDEPLNIEMFTQNGILTLQIRNGGV